jgi:predicted O-linked N-acetylglucosamine transferase (SPINDLY family)
LPREASTGVQEAFALALKHHQAGRLGEAERLYRQVLQADSRHADALHFLGVLAHQAGRNDMAVELIGKAIAQDGGVPAFHNNLGNALKAQGKFQEAAAAYTYALSLKPDNVAAHYNLGVALQAQGKLPEAAAAYRRALSHKPDHAEAYNNLGNVLHAQGKPEEALAAYSLALTHKPDLAEAHGNLGNVLKAQGKWDEAAASYQRALALKPQYAEAHSNLGNVLLEKDELDEAVTAYRRALALKPDHIEAYIGLGHALREQGKPDAAAAAYRQALVLNPDHADARLGLAIAAIPIFAESVADSVGAAEKFLRSLDELTAWSGAHPAKLGKSVGSNQPFYLAYRPFDARALLSRYGDLACAAAAAHWRRQSDGSQTLHPRRDRVRLAVVSGQVRQHPVWEVVLRGLIAHIDRRRIEIFLYHTGSLTDAETVWADSQVERFVQGPKPTPAWLDRIAQDQPDAIFYPEVGMDPATCALAALRLAPLQIAGWGHPVTTALPTMDVFLSGECLEGPRAEQHYREHLIRLPGTGVCTNFKPLQAQPWEGADRRSDIVRFTVCQQPIKFDPADDVLLARIAKAAGPSEFWLASPKKLHWATAKLRERLAAAFRTEGLDPDAHLRIVPWLPRGEFAGFLDEMDVYLDCPAFSGYTTAWQAIHRGLPIVTFEGDFLRQRLAAGLLRQIGITDGIASSRERYVEIAVRWAEECRRPGAWAERRETIRRAAPRADGNRAAVRAFEEMLVAAVTSRTPANH